MQSTTKKKNIEAAIQRALVIWIKETYPKVRVHATLNELARQHITMGCDVGIPDLLLFERRGKIMHAMFLELKKTKGKLSESQIDWHEHYCSDLKSSNTNYAVVYGFLAAQEAITNWLTTSEASK